MKNLGFVSGMMVAGSLLIGMLAFVMQLSPMGGTWGQFFGGATFLILAVIVIFGLAAFSVWMWGPA